MEKLKKIDIHAHCNLYESISPRYPYSELPMISTEKLLGFYDKLNIEKGVLLPLISPDATMQILTAEATKTAVDKYPDRFVWFCNVDARQYSIGKDGEPDYRYLIEHYKSLGAKGFGEFTTNLPVEDPRMQRVFAICEELGLPVTIHISPAVGTSYGIVDDKGLPQIEKTLKKYPKLKILGHSQLFWTEISKSEKRELYPWGKVEEGNLARLLRDNENLLCDVSAGSGMRAFMRDPEYCAKFVEEFADRIFYGCDICAENNTHPFAFEEFLNKMLEDKMISLENYNKFVRLNAEKLLNL